MNYKQWQEVTNVNRKLNFQSVYVSIRFRFRCAQMMLNCREHYYSTKIYLPYIRDSNDILI